MSSLYPDLGLCIQLPLMPIGPNLKVLAQSGRVDFKGSWIRVFCELGMQNPNFYSTFFIFNMLHPRGAISVLS